MKFLSIMFALFVGCLIPESGMASWTCQKVLAGVANRQPPPFDFTKSADIAWMMRIRTEMRQKTETEQRDLQAFLPEKTCLEAGLASVDKDLKARKIGLSASFNLKSENIGMTLNGLGKPYELSISGATLRRFRGDFPVLLLIEFHEIGHLLGAENFRNQ